VDGTLIPIDRIRADEPYCSMKHRKHGMNVQVITRPDGTPLWFSRATPGRTHDLTAARAHGIVQACLTRQILVLADRAYPGAGATFRTPYYHHRKQPEHYQQVNRDHARLRAPGERVFAQLKSWRLLRRLGGPPLSRVIRVPGRAVDRPRPSRPLPTMRVRSHAHTSGASRRVRRRTAPGSAVRWSRNAR
jgi:hypothetical protein